MRYLIDGYNLMFRVLRTGGELQAQREKIITNLNTKIEYLGLEATLVFDSQHQYGDLERSHYKHVEIIFTAQNETADECIIDELSRAKHPGDYTVVTSDKKLAWLARRGAAQTQTIEEFLGWLNKRAKNKLRRRKEPTASPEIPRMEKTPETRTDMERWLDAFEQEDDNV